jgi:hypothetical protein
LRHAWTKFSLCTSAALALALSASAVQAQRGDTTKRVNELTLAGLRPGRDMLPGAVKRYKAKYLSTAANGADAREWRDPCTGRALTVNIDEKSVIQEITVSSLASKDGKCDDRRFDALDMKDWTTGHGLRLGDARNRITELYGEPSSSGPSVKGSHELEFLYYAFDWAGADVPQVLEIYCERDTGRVVEITLAFPSL